MSGEELAAECRRRRRGLPIIFAADKPFLTADVKRAIETALAARARPSGKP